MIKIYLNPRAISRVFPELLSAIEENIKECIEKNESEFNFKDFMNYGLVEFTYDEEKRKIEYTYGLNDIGLRALMLNNINSIYNQHPFASDDIDDIPKQVMKQILETEEAIKILLENKENNFDKIKSIISFFEEGFYFTISYKNKDISFILQDKKSEHLYLDLITDKYTNKDIPRVEVLNDFYDIPDLEEHKLIISGYSNEINIIISKE